MSKAADAETWPTELGGRLLAALRDGADGHIDQELCPQIWKAPGRQEIMRLLTFCADSQATLRLYNKAVVGRFCTNAVDALRLALGNAKEMQRSDSWNGIQSCLRVLEGVILMCATDEDDRPWICYVVQSLLKSRILRASARLDCAVMSLSERRIRALYADESLPKQPDNLRDELYNLVCSVRPTPAHERRRQLVFEIFDEVVYRCFGVHGLQFGSAVNGFQMKSSDIDIMVLLEPDLQVKLISEARRQCATELERSEDERAANSSDWSFLSSRSQIKIASIAAVRALALELRNANLNVLEVIETARVPIVKCKYLQDEEGNDQDGESFEFEIDISFCNHIAFFNSKLLRAYADFDPRAMAVGLLVKLWAKRRKINSALEGTLSSYSYTLMAIHYLQHIGLLPNLQALSPERLQALQISSTENLLDGGHNVWFAEPDLYRKHVLGSQGDDPENHQLELQRWWLGDDPIKATVPELFYGFFRYFALEFNVYSDVVSIRFTEERVSKLSYFAVSEEEQEGSEVGDEDEQEEVEDTLYNACGPSDESPTSEGRFTGTLVSYDDEAGWGKLSCTEALDLWGGEILLDKEEYERSHAGVGDTVIFSVERGAKGQPLARNVQPPGLDAPAESSDTVASEAPLSANMRAASTADPASLAPLPEQLIGTVKTFNAETCYGFISCEATFGHYKRDVFLHQNQAVGINVGDRVSFQVELSAKGQPQARQVVKVSPDTKETPLALLLPTGEDASNETPKAEAVRGRLLSGRLGIAEKRLRGRHCLCIDDPMERHRTLGVTYTGQEAISMEILRALSILRNGERGAVEKIFKAVDKRPKAPGYQAREYNSVPAHVFGWSKETGEQRIVVEQERPIDKAMVGRIIGTGGAAIKNIRDESGVDDLHINDTRSGPVLYARGDAASVERAMGLAERAMNSKGKPKNRNDAVGSSGSREIASQRSQGGKGSSASSSSRLWGSKSPPTQQVQPLSNGTLASSHVQAPPAPPPMPNVAAAAAQIAQPRAPPGSPQQQSSRDAGAWDEGFPPSPSRVNHPTLMGEVRESQGLAGRRAPDVARSYYNQPVSALLATAPPSPSYTMSPSASKVNSFSKVDASRIEQAVPSSPSSSLKGTLQSVGVPPQQASKRPSSQTAAQAEPAPDAGAAPSAASSSAAKLAPETVGNPLAPAAGEAGAPGAEAEVAVLKTTASESHQRKKGNKIGAWKK